MVDPTILAIGAVTFLLVLVLILRNGAKEEPQKPSKKDKKQKQLQAKQQKPKKGRTALKKNERGGIPSEWQVVVDSAARDASEVLEFLKGKDPNEIAKQQGAATKPVSKKKGSNKKTKDEVQSSEDSATDDGSFEGFEEVKKKAPAEKKKKKKEKKQEEAKEHSKPYFKLLNPDGTPMKDEKPKRGEKKSRKSDGDAPQAEGPQKEGEKREKKSKSDGEKREPRERKEGEAERKREPKPPREPREPREPKPPREPREPRAPREPRDDRRPVTSPPNVAHGEQADIDEILNTITMDYNQKPKKQPTPASTTPRESTVFSKIERKLVKKILGYLSVRDLLAVSAVNHHLYATAHVDELWRSLCLRDLAIKHKDHKHRFFRLLYIEEYRKKGRKTKKDDATIPQGEEKDTKVKKNEQASKEVVVEE